MTSKPQEIELDGATVKLAAKRWTTGDVPVLALHGWLDNAGTFDRLAPFMQGLDLVAMDFPGHGCSGARPSSDNYHFVDWIPEIFSAADSLGWERFALLGHSMGAAVACLAAGCFPERVTRLALIEGLGPFTTPEEEAPKLLAKALLHRSPTRRRVYATWEQAVVRLMARDLLPESARCLAVRALEEVEGGWSFNYAEAVRVPSRFRLSEPQIRAFLRAITAPTLLIVAKDGLQVPDSYAGREREIKDLATRNFEGGHHIHLDYPERVHEVVQRHLSGNLTDVALV